MDGLHRSDRPIRQQAAFNEAMRQAGDHQVLMTIAAANREAGAFDIQLEVWLQTPKMREAGHLGERLVSSNFNSAYWTAAQMVAHHTVNGCNLQPGDLLGTGTLSGPVITFARSPGPPAFRMVVPHGYHPQARGGGNFRAAGPSPSDIDTLPLSSHSTGADFASNCSGST